METPTPKPKETWTKPELILIEVNKIKQEALVVGQFLGILLLVAT